MADINSNIRINIETAGALANLKALQGEISAFQIQMAKGTASMASQAAGMQQNLINNINSTGKFAASMRTISTTTESFTKSLENNKLSMREYFRYAGASTKSFGQLFGNEFATINKVARERVKDLQTQYIKMGRDANGAMKAIAVRPLSLDMNDLATKTAIAAQKQQILNQLLKQGSTNLLNWGKNTQWAGRQLMVGFSIPLAMFAASAGKAYMAMEQQVVMFKRVYGDLNTTDQQTNKMVSNIRSLSNEFTKFGIATSDTMGLAAKIAAMGAQGSDLLAKVRETSRMAALGGVTQDQALETTISLTNAFGIASKDLATNVDFLNYTQNQTVLSLQDMTEAFPKAGPVVKQLGGDVKDLTFFMTAMREGGISAAQGANAIKSGLASIINPTKAASDFLSKFNINLAGIVSSNKGNIRQTVVDLGNALNKLDPLNRAQAIEKLFGKFQFSRISTLLKNVTDANSQASKVMDISNKSKAELSILSERELKKVSDSPMYKFKKAVQDLKTAIIPLGEMLIRQFTPFIKMISGIAKSFDKMDGGTKDFISKIVTYVAGLGPVVLMVVGLVANGIANIIKLFANVKSFFNNIGKSEAVLGEQTAFLTTEQIKAQAVAASLDQVHNKLKQTFTSEAGAVEKLTVAYQEAILAQQRLGMAGPIIGRGAIRAATGIITGPGTSTSDSIPAMLSNGEAVIPAKSVQKYPGMVAGLIAGNIPGFSKGTQGTSLYGGAQRLLSPYTMPAPGNTSTGFGMSREFVGTAQFQESLKRSLIAMTAVENNITLTDRALSTLTPVATKTSSAIANALMTAMQEAEQSGVELTHISQVFELAQPKIRKIMSQLETQGMQGMARGIQRFAYPTQADLLGGGLSRQVAAKFDENGNFTKLSSFSSKTGLAKSFEKRMAGLTEKLGKIVFNSQKVTAAHVSELQIISSEIAPIRGGARALAASQQSPAIQNLISKSEGILGRSLTVQEKQLLQQEMVNVEQNTQVSTSKKKTAAAKKSAAIAEQTATEEEAILKEKQAQLATEQRRTKASGQYRDPITGRFASQPQQIVPDSATKQGILSRMFGNNASGMSRMGIGMGLSMLPMAMSMSGNKQMADIGGQLQMPAMLASMALMLPGPIGIAAAALIGLGSVVNMVIQQQQKEIAQAKQLVDSMSMTNQKLVNMSKVFGTVSATEARQKAQADAIAGITTSKKSDKLAQQYMQSSSGKALLGDVRTQLSSGASMSDVAKNMSSQLSMAIIQGVVTPDQARSIAKGLGAKLKNQSISAEIIGNISTLFGPDGKDLSKNPLALNTVVKSIGQNNLAALNTGFGGLGTDAISNAQANLEKAKADYKKQNTIQGYQNIQEAQNKLTDIKNSVSLTAKDYAVISEIAIKTAQSNQQSIDAINAQFDGLEKQAKTQKQINALEVQRKSVLSTQQGISNKMYDKLYANLKMVGAGEYNKNVQSSVDTLYKNDPIMKTLADSSLKALWSGGIKGKARIMLETELAAGNLSPTTLNLITKFDKNKKFTANIQTAITSVGGAKVDQLIQTLSATGANDGTISRTLNFAINKNGPGFDKTLEAIQQIATMKNTYGINIDINDGKSVAKFAQINDFFSKKNNGVITKKVIIDTINNGTQETGLNTRMLKSIKSEWEDLQKLDPVIRRQIITTLLTIDPGKLISDSGLQMPGASPETLLNAATAIYIKKVAAVQKALAAAGLTTGTTTGGGGGTKANPWADFIAAQKKAITDIANQNKAIKKLVAAGTSLGTAFKIAENPELAAAIAHEKNGKKIKELIALYEKATAATKKFADAQTDAAAAEDLKSKKDLLQALMIAKMAGATNDQLNAIKNLTSTNITRIIKIGFNDAQVQNALQTAVDATHITAQIEAITLSPAAQLQQSFGSIMSLVQQSFDAQAQAARLAAQGSINAQQAVIDGIQNNIDAAQAKIDAAQTQIDGLQNKIDLYNRDLDKIQQQEDALNATYDKQTKALNDIKDANAELAQQEKSKLDIASALASGDVYAAAKAEQDMRAQAAATSLANQQKALDEAHQKALDAITVNGKTRKQIEQAIKDLNEQIYQIQVNQIKPQEEYIKGQEKLLNAAQKQLDTLQKNLETSIQNNTVLGLTAEQWAKVQSAIDMAALSGVDFNQQLIDAINNTAGLADVLAGLGFNIPGVTGTATGGAYKPTVPYPKTTAEVAALSYADAAYYGIDPGIVRAARQSLGLPLATGGLVPKFYATGGYARGTDTVPAMLTPGEFVVKKYAVDSFGADKLHEINSGILKRDDINKNGSVDNSSVYNSYAVNVHVNNDADANDIARTVITKIREIDSQKIRTNRF